jgi:hypothetical protein
VIPEEFEEITQSKRTEELLRCQQFKFIMNKEEVFIEKKKIKEQILNFCQEQPTS